MATRVLKAELTFKMEFDEDTTEEQLNRAQSQAIAIITSAETYVPGWTLETVTAENI